VIVESRTGSAGLIVLLVAPGLIEALGIAAHARAA
jgi:hypothetical protein